MFVSHTSVTGSDLSALLAKLDKKVEAVAFNTNIVKSILPGTAPLMNTNELKQHHSVCNGRTHSHAAMVQE